MTPDVNVLVAAFRPDHPCHSAARIWLTQARAACAAGQDSLRLLPMVLAGFLRLVTNPKVFAEPDPVEDALRFAHVLLATPGVELASCGEEWPLLREKVRARSLTGNKIPDAWIAACVEHFDEHLVTFDRGFRQLLHVKAYTLLT
jgi:toxin-antitoxin system PIN domain toxin